VGVPRVGGGGGGGRGGGVGGVSCDLFGGGGGCGGGASGYLPILSEWPHATWPQGRRTDARPVGRHRTTGQPRGPRPIQDTAANPRTGAGSLSRCGNADGPTGPAYSRPRRLVRAIPTGRRRWQLRRVHWQRNHPFPTSRGVWWAAMLAVPADRHCCFRWRSFYRRADRRFRRRDGLGPTPPDGSRMIGVPRTIVGLVRYGGADAICPLRRPMPAAGRPA
jgi:hypothetical protein